jgi:hypothetical protein
MVSFPLDAGEIYVEWVTTEGGIGVTAFTDEKGLPFIGLYPLNRMGRPNGLPCWFRRSRFMSDIVIGFRERTPIVVFIDVEVSERGLSLIVCVPFDTSRRYERHTFAPWGSKSPCYGFIAFPSNSNWPINPFPQVSE